MENQVPEYGYEAFEQGYSELDNPFREGTQLARDWDEDFFQAQLDSEI